MPQDLHLQLIELLQQFELFYKIPNEDTLLLPSLLPETCVNLQTVWPTHEPNSCEFTRYYVCHFILAGFFSRLLVRLCHDFRYLRCWLHGIVIEDDSALSLVQINVKEKRISVSVRSRTFGVYPIKFFTKLTELIEAMIQYEFKMQLSTEFPCNLCLAKLSSKPHIFTADDIQLALEKDSLLECEELGESLKMHRVPVFNVAPDYVLSDIDENQIDLNSIELGLSIGEGAFADVYKATYRGDTVAVKILKSREIESERFILNEFRHEIRAMRLIYFPLIDNQWAKAS